MRLVDTSSITTTVGMPEKAGTLVHIQTSIKETVAEILKSLAGPAYSGSIPYRIEGLINTAGSVSAGSVFFGGEVYLVDAFSLPSPANAALAITFFTDVSADPVSFTDGTPRNVHQIRKITFGTPVGLGFNFSQLQELNSPQWVVDNTSSNFVVKFDKPNYFYRSWQAAGSGTTFVINLDGTNAVDGVESVCMFQSFNSVAVAFTINQINGVSDLMGVGGYSNPLTISIGGTNYYVMRFKCWKPTGLGVTAISINVTEHT